MKRTAVVASVVAAGFLTPTLAFAATPPPPPTTSVTVITDPPPTVITDPSSPAPKPSSVSIKLSTAVAHPGDKFTAVGHCANPSPGVNDYWFSASEGIKELDRNVERHDRQYVVRSTFQVMPQAKPGGHVVTMSCGDKSADAWSLSSQPLPIEVVLKEAAPKQVTKVPAGAPQTGGGPADDTSNGPAVAAAAMGVLALGGTGLVVARRRRAQR